MANRVLKATDLTIDGNLVVTGTTASVESTNSTLKDYCYNQICKACILKYDSKQLGIDDVEETDEVVDEL